MVSFCWQSPATLQGVDESAARICMFNKQTKDNKLHTDCLNITSHESQAMWTHPYLVDRQIDGQTLIHREKKRKMRYRMSASKFTNKSIKLSVATVGFVFVVFPYCCRREQEGQTTTETPRRGCAHQTPEARTYQTRPHGMVWQPPITPNSNGCYLLRYGWLRP